MRAKTILPELPELQTLLDAFPKEFVEIAPREQGIALVLYRLLAMGQPVSHQQLADASTIPLAEIDRLLAGWIATYHDDSGRVTGFWGLTLNETPHKLLLDDHTLYAWCAWDTLFLPSLIGQATRVISRCVSSGQQIQLSIDGKHITSLVPEGTVLSFVLPDEEAIRKDVVSSFCHSVLFFASLEQGEKWIAKHPGTFLISVERAFELAQLFNERKFPELRLKATD